MKPNPPFPKIILIPPSIPVLTTQAFSLGKRS
jgi:hypothetical protein